MFLLWGGVCGCSALPPVAVPVNNPPALENKSPPGEQQRWMFLSGCSHQFCSATWQRQLWNKPPTLTQKTKTGEHFVVCCVQRLSITTTGSGKNVVACWLPKCFLSFTEMFQRVARALLSAGNQTAEVAGKRRPAKEERWENTTLRPPLSWLSSLGFEINIDKVG